MNGYMHMLCSDLIITLFTCLYNCASEMLNVWRPVLMLETTRCPVKGVTE